MQTRSILILVWPEASAYNATFRLARALKQSGHKIAYAAPIRWQTYIASQEFPTVTLEVSEGLSTDSMEPNIIGISRSKAEKRIGDLVESLAELDCGTIHLVLLDPILWHYALPFLRLGIPYVLVNANLGSPWNWNVPPIFSDLLPLHRHPLLNRVRCAGAWFAFRYFGSFNHRYLGRIQPRGFGVLNRIRDALITTKHLFRCIMEPIFMPVGHKMLEISRRNGIIIRWGDYGYRLVDTELVLGPEAIDLQGHHCRYSRTYVGACVDTSRVEDGFDWTPIDPDKRLVYCSIGSHGTHWNVENRLKLLESIVEAFRAHPEYQVLLQTVREDEYRRSTPLPDNILTAFWFPQLQILARASVVITHGGFGTVREALFFGVPMIVFPYGVDQPGNAARIERLHAGVMGDIRSVTPEKISSLLRTVELPQYRQNAQRLSSVLRAQNTCREAIVSIEDFLDGTLTDGRPTLSLRPPPNAGPLRA